MGEGLRRAVKAAKATRKKSGPKVPRSEWTALEHRFDQLVALSESRDQVQRVMGRLDLNRFVKEHGKDACDAMWERIK